MSKPIPATTAISAASSSRRFTPIAEDDASFWALPANELVEHLGTNLETGLSEVEAMERLQRIGKNELPPSKETPFWKLLLKQFQDFLVLILLFAACVSFVLALLETDADQKVTAFVEPFVILAILVVNAAVGVVQETNAERAIAALKRYEASKAAVLRNSVWREVHPTELVPGDVISLSTGRKVPADCRICKLHSSVLRVDQSLLTGEADNVTKDEIAVVKNNIVDQDKTNVCFSGTLVTRGKAICVVVLTGSQTSIGRIFRNLNQSGGDDDDDAEPKLEKHKSPLKEKLDEFGESLSKIIFGICVLVWLINIKHFSDPERGGFIKGAIYYFKIAVALAVAAVPEGLPAVVTTCLALGAREMAKEGAIVRVLPAVETLGCTTVICADKTGTITTNRMAVQRVLCFTAGMPVVQMMEFTVEGKDYTPKGQILKDGKVVAQPCAHPALADCAKISALCNESRLDFDVKSRAFTFLGEPTEAALRVLVEKIGYPKPTGGAQSESADLQDAMQAVTRNAPLDTILKTAQKSSYLYEKEHPVETVLEFTRSRKSMSVICKTPNKSTSHKSYLFCKGAPRSVLDRCDRIRLDSGGTAPLDAATKQAILAKVEALGTEAFRCLALAQTELVGGVPASYREEDLERGMTLVGLVAMSDPIRQQVPGAIEGCLNAGMRVVLCTGDDKQTAEAVARQVGMLRGGEEDFKLTGKSLSGEQLAQMDERAQKEACLRLAVLYRVEPAHKSLLVSHLQSMGEIVAMTGDGVNDAPALKRADIGIAMGSGTAVARESSDLILQDDNFATIVSAVRHGRAIYQNTKQFIRYLVSSNLGEVACIFFTAALGIPEALVPVQLLWVNLVTDGLPATALGFNPPDPNVMRKKPRARKAPLVDRWSFIRFFIVGLYVGVAVVMGFVWWFTAFENGPLISFYELRTHDKCESEKFAMQNGFDCSLFKGNFEKASTVSLSILVFIEMLNAFNALSENESLFEVPPWTNKYLLMAVACSVSLHLFIVNVPYFSAIFYVKNMSVDEWGAIFWFSAPVIVIDEMLKLCTRRLQSSHSSLSALVSFSANKVLTKRSMTKDEEKNNEDKLV